MSVKKSEAAEMLSSHRLVLVAASGKIKHEKSRALNARVRARVRVKHYARRKLAGRLFTSANSLSLFLSLYLSLSVAVNSFKHRTEGTERESS